VFRVLLYGVCSTSTVAAEGDPGPKYGSYAYHPPNRAWYVERLQCTHVGRTWIEERERCEAQTRRWELRKCSPTMFVESQKDNEPRGDIVARSRLLREGCMSDRVNLREMTGCLSDFVRIMTCSPEVTLVAGADRQTASTTKTR
jgi:hypothetical protein